jgi:hypothetical protein
MSPGVQLVNTYGPTEATVVSTRCELSGPAAATASSGEAPIGRAIPGVQVCVLDRHLHPVPVGVVGELYLGGAGLARGYLGRPGLTAERFLPHPFEAEPGARLYRTGDRARWLPDGNLEFLGRTDHQVKIRGFRIEPGEVEAVLLRHPGVREAVVVAREDVPGEKRLAAYVVPRGPQAQAAGELRGFLRSRLPAYLVPSAFVTLGSLPLTPGGKVDRRALPAPEGGGECVPPRTAAERELARVWSEVLGVERVGVYDDFFELGGHSLLAARVAARVRQGLGVDLPLPVLFEAPTVAALAEEIARRRKEQEDGRQLDRLLEEIEGLSEEEVEAALTGDQPDE